MQVLETIQTRRSIRKFKNQDVPDDLINQILTAGTWAPYGRNQIWRFAVIKDLSLKSDIAKLTAYAKIIENAPVIIPVFFDRRKTYHNMKDAQTMGACIQNMLLAIHGLGLAAVWIGEILKRKKAVQKLCDAPESFELSAVIALGYGKQKGIIEKRLGLGQVVFLRK